MAKTIIGKIGITPKGQYSDNVMYSKLDAVHYKGAMYVCLKECSGVIPANSEYWFLSAEQGEKPVNGEDYNTEAQKEEFKQAVIADSKEDIDNYTVERKQEIADTTASVVNEVQIEGTTQISNVNSAGATQVESINTIGATQVSNIEAKGTEQVSNIEIAGLAQIKNIEDTATAKTTEFNENITAQTNTFNTNAQEKTKAYNDNDIAKTTAYNDNATAKTLDFDNNATAKTNLFDENAVEKTTEFNENAESYEKRIAELEVENEELAEQMPWAATEQAESIHIEDCARYSRNRLNVFGNLKQETRSGKNILDTKTLLIDSITKNDVKYIKNEDGTFDVSGTANAVTAIQLANLTEVLERNTAYHFYSSKSYDATTFNLCIVVTYEDGTRQYFLANKVLTLNDKVITNATMQFYAEAGTTINTATKVKLMITKSTETDNNYEEYGAMPSIEYPSIPQTISGVQKFRRCGKNILSRNFVSGFIPIEGEYPLENTQYPTSKYVLLKLRKGKTYNINCYVNGVLSNLTNGRLRCIDIETKKSIGNIVIDSNTYYTSEKDYTSSIQQTGTITAKKDFILGVLFLIGTDTNICEIQIGENLTEYEKYDGEEITLDLGDTELCKITDESGNVIAQDRVVYREVDGVWKWQWEKNIKKIILDGTRPYLKSIYSDDTYFRGYLKSSISDMNNTCIICDKLKTKNYVSGYIGECIAPTTQFHVSILASRLTENTADALNNYLKDNQLTCYYPLLASTYEDCTEEQSKQLDELYKLYLQKGTNNIINENENGISCEMQLEYMQDLMLKHDNDIAELREAVLALGGN